MSSCSHHTLVQVTARSNTALALCNLRRQERILRNLSCPDEQTPSMVLFLGSKHKNLALANLYKLKYGRGIGSSVSSSLHIDPSTSELDRPIYIAQSDLSVPGTAVGRHQSCHETFSTSVRWTANKQELWPALHTRFLFLFADVICLFADDFGGVQASVKILCKLTQFGSASSAPRQIRPRVLVISSHEQVSPTARVLEMEECRYNLMQETGRDLLDMYSEVLLIQVPGDHCSPRAKYRVLKESIAKHTGQMQQIRTSFSYLFSARHMSAFMEQAIEHTAYTSDQPFNFVMESRRSNPIDPAFSEHLSRFLRLATGLKAPHELLASYVASSILMDAYPPGSHRFNAKEVFDTLYKETCLRAFAKQYSHEGSSVSTWHCNRVETYLIQFFACLEKADAAEIHAKNIRQHQHWWTGIKTNKTCLLCLSSRPECVGPCGHSVCEDCIRRFGKKNRLWGDEFDLSSCLLCGSTGWSSRLKPCTAGVNILSIDGGGARGVVPLEFLTLIQSRLGSACKLQDLFDLVFGTSSGGLISIALFIRGWSARKSLEHFRSMAHKVFEKPDHNKHLLGKARKYFRSWLSDGYYNTEILEKTLQESYGTDLTMFDSEATNSSTKVAVTAATIGNASTYIFSNYNGVAERSASCGYNHVRPEEVGNEPLVWQAARATSAAPALFETVQIPNIGSFQDGGLKENNPVRLAMWESKNLWPNIANPDLVLSLGTGTSTSSYTSPPVFTNLINDGFLPRTHRWIKSLFDGEGGWKGLLNDIDAKYRDKFIRMNVSIPESALGLDDIDGMESLSKAVFVAYQSRGEDSAIAAALLLSRLYFSLDCKPTYTAYAEYHCRGTIRSRIPGHNFSKAISKLGIDSAYFMLGEEVLAHTKWEEDVCNVCHCFRVKVEFCVTSLHQRVELNIQAGSSRRAMSSFPQCIDWFVEQQGLNANFGRKDLGNDAGLTGCHVCDVTEVSVGKRVAPSRPQRQSKRIKKLCDIAEGGQGD